MPSSAVLEEASESPLQVRLRSLLVFFIGQDFFLARHRPCCEFTIS